MIVSRLRAVMIAATLATVAVLAVAAEAHGSKAPSASGRDGDRAARRLARPARDADGLTVTESSARRGVTNYTRARAAVRAEFGTGPTAACVLRIANRETGGTYNPHAANWHDHHSDGSRGSFGLMQIGALWRREGESVDGFARRMFGLGENLRVAHRLVRSSGFAPWGGC